MNMELGNLFKNLRKQEHVTQDRLCHGICSKSMYSRFEKGERWPGKNMIDRFFSRLGLDPEKHTNILDRIEFEETEQKRDIIEKILSGRYAEGKNTLENFDRKLGSTDKLNKQFSSIIHIELDRLEGFRSENLNDRLWAALHLTLPGLNKENYENFLFSLEESHLFIDALSDLKENGDALYGFNIFIMERYKDKTLLAKVCPKAAVQYLHLLTPEEKKESSKSLIFLLEKTLGILRNADRTYYLSDVLASLSELYTLEGDKEKADMYGEWTKALTWVYSLYDLYPSSFTDTVFFLDQRVFCIDYMLAGRRKMNGLSINSLSADICDSRTLSSMENAKRKSQNATVMDIMHGLGMPEAIYLSIMMSQDLTDRTLVERSYNEYNSGNYHEALAALNNSGISENSHDRRKKERMKYLSAFKIGEISKETLTDKLLALLEESVKFDYITVDSIRYLTNEELFCLRNLLHYGNDKISLKVLTLLSAYLKEISPLKDPDLFCTLSVALESELCNLNRIDEALGVLGKMANAELLTGRLDHIVTIVYDRYWIYQLKKELNPQVPPNICMMCKTLSLLKGDERSANFFCKAIEKFQATSLSSSRS